MFKLTDKYCDECGRKLYVTKLEAKLWCKKCREYRGYYNDG